jgi:hypothetical protein
MRRFLAGDFNILARNIFEIWAKKYKKLQFFDTPWHTESRSNGANFWLVMRVHTLTQGITIYGLGLMVTKRPHQVDGWMGGQMDATRTILLPQLSAELKMTTKFGKL